MSLFRMPSLGSDMESGTLIEWLKRPGEKVSRGDVIAVVETQKGAIEIEIFESGIIGKFLVQPGTKVPVGEPLAEIADTSEQVETTPVPKPLEVTQPSSMTAPPRLRPVSAPASPSEKTASPAARRLATEHGLDLSAVTGSGPDGAIVFLDVEHALSKTPARKSQMKQPIGPDIGEMRKAIASAMSRSKREIPHYYLSHSVNLEPARAWLANTNANRVPEKRVLLGALLIKAVAKGLEGMPDFNGFYIDGSYRPSTEIHIGTATAVRGGGLVAPAIHTVDRLSIDELMAKLRDLVGRVRSGHLRGSELADPTITISSLGDRGVEALYGIVHPPQVALVGFGAPQVRPWVSGTSVIAGSVITMTLAADHRVSDGHRGALFLCAIGSALESPESL